MSAPPIKRIVSTGVSKVTLPAMPSMPVSAAMPSTMAGAAGSNPGLAGAPTAGAGQSGGGGPISLFGLRELSGPGLEGHFYDFKKDPGSHPVPYNAPIYAGIVKALTSSWVFPGSYKALASPAKLYSRYFFFPAIHDTEAGVAFQAPKAGPGGWLVNYKGSVAAQSGKYRFVGFGDNVMIVRLGGNLVLDASDHGYTGLNREAAGTIAFPNKRNTPLFLGSWFEMQSGSAKTIEVAIGDEGGIFCAGIFLQKDDVPYKQGAQGIPELPLFMIGPPSAADRKLLEQYLPATCLQGPYFQPGAKGIFNR